MAQKRLFVGLSFSQKFVRDLEPWTKKIKKTADKKETSLFWTPSDNLHVTLVFLGNTAEELIPQIQAKMAHVAARHSQFKLKMRGLDGFPNIMQARVLYLGVQRSQNILNLQSDLEQSLLPASKHEPEYQPHMTLARLRNPKSCTDLVSPFEHIDLGRQQVAEITLYSSELHGNAVVYQKLFQAPLTHYIEQESFL